MVKLAIKRIFEDAELPIRHHEGDIGFDLHAYAKSETGQPKHILMPAWQTRAVRTGICIGFPEYIYGEVYSRSGLARDNAIFVANAPGLVDSGYIGEIMVLLYNGSPQSQHLKHGDRIAQIVFKRALSSIEFDEVDELPERDRGTAGFGSTGLSAHSAQGGKKKEVKNVQRSTKS